MNPRSARRLSGLVFFLVASLVSAGQEPASNILERFSVSANGDYLILPVTLKGKTYSFIVDTGATHTNFDTSLPLGPVKEKKSSTTAGGQMDVPLYAAPEAKVGKLDLAVGELVVGHDFSQVREVAGQEIFGLIGLDFLSRHVVQIDFDRGEMLFLKKADPKVGAKVRLLSQESTRPWVWVEGKIQEGDPIRFLLDTGADSSGLETKIADALVKHGILRVVGQSMHITIAGIVAERHLKAKKFSVGEFAVAGAILDESQLNLLGREFLSRFKITIDFPNGVLYLEKGKRYTEPDVWDLSGLHLLRKQGQVVVYSVDKGSVALTAGIQAGDKILKIGDKKTDALSMFEVRRTLGKPGTTVKLDVQREEKAFAASLALKD